MSPDLDTLTDLAAIIEAWEQSGSSVARLLQETLSLVQQRLPEATALRLYEVSGESLFLTAASDRNVDEGELSVAIASAVEYSVALATRSATLKADNSARLIALWSEHKAFALLEVLTDSEKSPTELPREWLGKVGVELEGALNRRMVQQEQSRRLQALTSQIIDTNRSIARAADDGEICQAVLDVMPDNIILTAIYLYDRNVTLEELPNSVSIKVVATKKRVIYPEVSDDLASKTEQMAPIIRQHLDGKIFITEDARQMDSYLMPNCVDFLMSLTANSYVVVGLRYGEKLLGVLLAGARENVNFDSDRLANVVIIADQAAITIENRRLLVEAQEATERLNRQLEIAETVNILSAKLATAQDEGTALAQTCEALVNAVGCEFANIALLNDDNETTTFVSEYPVRGLVGIVVDKDDVLMGKMQEGKQPLAINDIAKAQDLQDQARTALQRFGVKSILIIPLLDASDVYIGSIGLDYVTEAHVFTQEMIDIARTIGSSLAIVLQNNRLLQSARRQAHQMEQVVAFGQTLHSVFEMEELLETALEHFANVMNAEHVGVLHFDTAQSRLKPVAWRDDGTSYISLGNALSVNLQDTVAGRAWEMKSSLQIRDLHTASELRHTSREDIRAVLAMTVFAHGAPYGVVEIGATRPSAFSTIDNVILQQLTNQLSASIEGVETYEQGQRVTKTKTLANEISTQLQQQIEIDQILRVTVSELGKALGAKRGSIQLAPSGVVQRNGTE
jgi:GAF domain-containing protein